MAVPSRVAGWNEVRNHELSDIITRRFSVGALSRTIIIERYLHAWAEQGYLPSEPNWKPDKLAMVLTEWLDARSLAPGFLAKILERRAKAGLLLPDTNLTEDKLAAAFQSAADPCVSCVAKLANLFKLRPANEVTFAKEMQTLLGNCYMQRLLRVEESLGNHQGTGDASGPSNRPEHGGELLDDDVEEAEGQRIGAREFGEDGPTHVNGAVVILNAMILEALLRKEVSRDLVGLALSGGGIRSASFNLGLLQALQKARLLQEVDYLSTVSGGGYVGSLVSSLVYQNKVCPARQSEHARPPCSDVPSGKPKSSSASSGHELLTACLAPDVNGKQPERVRKLVRSGSFLNKPTLHLSRYLAGVLLNNLVIFSALLALCTLAAVAWRWLDTYPVAEWLRLGSGGWIADWDRPFLPALALLLAWAATSALRLACYGDCGRVARFLLIGAGMCFWIGAAVWLATPHIDVPLLALQSPGTGPQLLPMENRPLMFLLVLVFLGMLPFLRPARFLASGTQANSSMLETVAFRVLSLALLAGIPFVLVYVMARHDIAAQTASLAPAFTTEAETEAERDRGDSTRRWRLHPTDIHYARWGGFWKRLREEANTEGTVGWHIWSERLKASQAQIQETLAEPWLKLIEEVPIPLDADARDKKNAVINALNEHVLVDITLPAAILANPETLASIQKQSETMAEGQRLRSLLERHKLHRLIAEDKRELGRLALEAYYHWFIWERAIVRRSVVIDRDQAFRVKALALFAALALAASLVVGLNTTSLHGIYRRQLAHVYLEPVAAQTPDIPLHKLETTDQGAPYHLLSGSLNKGITQAADDMRPTAHFLFSRRFCGSTITGFVPSEEYLDGTLDLATAMAISGAAFSPTRMQNRLIAFLMVVLNARLGQWLPSPRYPRRVRWLPMLRLLASLLYYRRVQDCRYWFISDGGHSENLGLGPLLRRECQLMIVSDAGQDPDYGFDDFVRLYRHARIHGVRFRTLDQSGFIRLDPLVPDKATGNSPHRYVIARVDYPGPGDKWGLLIYIKPSFAGDEGMDLTRYRKVNTAFPHDPTVNQWFDEDQVESYRELGAWIGQRACALLLQELFRERCRHPGKFDAVVELVRQERLQDAAGDLVHKAKAIFRQVEELKADVQHNDNSEPRGTRRTVEEETVMTPGARG